MSKFSKNVSKFFKPVTVPIKTFFHKKPVFITSHVLGIIISVIGVIICLGMVIGTSIFNSTAREKTNEIETTLITQVDKSEETLNTFETAVVAFVSINEIETEISELVDKNVERLESLQDTLDAFNFNGRLDSSIDQVDKLIAVTKSVQLITGTIDEIKVQITTQVKQLYQYIDDARTKISDGARTIRTVVLYAFSVTVILAIIFLLGEYTLLRRCIIGLKTYKKIGTV